MNSLSNTEIKMLIQLLEDLYDQQSDAGCNDLFLPLIEDNKEFAQMLNTTVKEDLQLTIGKKDITGMDMVVTSYFIKKLKNMVQ